MNNKSQGDGGVFSVPNIRGAGGLGQDKAEGVFWPLWDTGLIATTGTTQLNLFTQPIGQNAKTRLDTNMNLAGQISGGTGYVIRGIGFGLQNSAAVAIPVDEFREILYTGFLQLQIADRTYFECRLDALPYGGGAYIDGAVAAAAGTFAPNSGVPQSDAFNEWTYAVHLPKNVSFSVDISWPVAPTPTTAIRCVVMFRGILQRPALG